MSRRRDLEGELAFLIESARLLPPPERGWRFAARHVGLGRGVRARLKAAGLRDWVFDFAWPALKLAVEVDGGVWVYGRHNRPQGYEDDCRKCNAAQLLGWRVLHFTAGMIDSGEALATLERGLEEA